MLCFAIAAAVLGVGSLANAACSHDVTTVKAAVTVADDLSWQ